MGRLLSVSKLQVQNPGNIQTQEQTHPAFQRNSSESPQWELEPAAQSPQWNSGELEEDLGGYSMEEELVLCGWCWLIGADCVAGAG